MSLGRANLALPIAESIQADARRTGGEVGALVTLARAQAAAGRVADARQTVEFVSRNAAPCNWRNFTVTGHADRSGGNEYNMGLSQRRADAVAALMASMGIPSASIHTAARGEEQPRVPTEDGVRELQNRRVEIVIQ